MPAAKVRITDHALHPCASHCELETRNVGSGVKTRILRMRFEARPLRPNRRITVPSRQTINRISPSRPRAGL